MWVSGSSNWFTLDIVPIKGQQEKFLVYCLKNTECLSWSYSCLHANPLARSPGQVKIMIFFCWKNRKFSIWLLGKQVKKNKGKDWHGSWIHKYICYQYLSLLTLWVRIPLMVSCTRYIQHYVIKFVSDLRQVCGLVWVIRFLPPMKLADMI
jgi:hypothetical protein